MSTEQPFGADDKPIRGIHGFVRRYIRELPDLTGKTVLDIPSGDGRSTWEFKKRGATVISLDLFPEFMKVSDVEARFADLSEKLPVDDATIDMIICQEGIEHVPNQLFVLQEFNRVLKPGGQLLMTTPNASQLRARLSGFLFETDFWKRMPPTAVDSVWFANESSEKLYFGHLFLVGVQHLQTLMDISGFKVTERVKTDVGTTAVLLGITYPLLALFSFLTPRFYRKKIKAGSDELVNGIFRERAKLNLSPKTLFCKHIFWVAEKERSLSETSAYLKTVVRD